MENKIYEHIPQEKFAFAQLDANIHDKKLETKSRGYFTDALLRFKKNKSSVIAAYIIAFLLLFSILAPIISPYSVYDKDVVYTNYAPYVESIAQKGWGIFDGAKVLDSQNDRQYAALQAVAQETGYDPIIEIISTDVTTERVRGKDVEKKTYAVEVNQYYRVGIVSRNISYEEYENIQKFQDETGLQVLYPMVVQKDIYPEGTDLSIINALPKDQNLWYKCKNTKNEPVDADPTTDGIQFVPAYTTNTNLEGKVPYTSTRIESDPGNYIYSFEKQDAVQVRVCYYNFYQYQQWKESGGEKYGPPTYIFGTNSLGQDIFCAIGVGARFSILFAILVSAVNLIIGAVYGAIQGYYGGTIDLVLDRISDVLSGVPQIVVITLFQYHLGEKFGPFPAFIFAFILTGWIGMAALTRKQFYRFKSQEHIMAARTLGASDWRLMFKHIFPNSLGTIVTSCALVIPGVISSETSLTYLNIIDLSKVAGTTLGTLMKQGQGAMTAAPHAMLFPALFFSLLMISFNLFGNGLRDAFNPATKGAD